MEEVKGITIGFKDVKEEEEKQKKENLKLEKSLKKDVSRDKEAK